MHPGESEPNLEELLRRGLDASPISIAFHRRDGTYRGVNAAWEKLFGRRERDVIGHHFLEYTEDIDLERSQEIYRRLRSGESDEVVFSKRYRGASGNVIWGRVTLTAVRGSDGELHSTIAQIEDVTEHRLREDELSITRSMLADAQEIGKVGTFVAWLTPDKHGLEAWSKSCMEIFGYDEATYDGRGETFWNAVHPDDREMVRAAAEKAHRDPGSHYEMTHRIIRRDGEVRWIRERAVVEHDAAGNPLRFIGVTLDIT